MKILVVDDDAALTKLISNRLKQEHYVVETAQNAEYAMDLLAATPYSLVVLDVVLPDVSGLEVCQTLRRQKNQTPILMLTGQDHTQDKVMGLDAGADDYLVKPFELSELTARVRALLRRNSEDPSTVLSYGELKFDSVAQTLTYNSQPVPVRPKELAILELLLRYPTHIFSPNALLDKLWNLADCPGPATIKTHIRSLRKRLDGMGARNLIETLYGRGYRLNPVFLDQAAAEKTAFEKTAFEKTAAEKTAAEKTEENGKKGGLAKPSENNIASQQAVNREDVSPLDNSQSPVHNNQLIMAQTWQQVQAISWQRFVQLQVLISSLFTDVTPSDETSQPEPQPDKVETAAVPVQSHWQPTIKRAIAIAHQLKGTLGSFGFLAASAQAREVEQQLRAMNAACGHASDPCATNKAENLATNLPSLRCDLMRLQRQLQQHITDPSLLDGSLPDGSLPGGFLPGGFLPGGSLRSDAPSTDALLLDDSAVASMHGTHPATVPLEQALQGTAPASLLVVSHNQDWADQLQNSSPPLAMTIYTCHHLHITDFLLEREPSVIFLEISEAQQADNLGLLSVLVSNYGSRVPIVALVSSGNRAQQLLAVQNGAQAIALNSWSDRTLLSIAAEYC